MGKYLDEAGPIRPGEELDVARLESYLHDHLPEVAGPLLVEQFPSGYSNLTYLVRMAGLDAVLRRPPFGNRVQTAHDMGREYQALAALHPIYPLAPRPLLYCADATVIGAPFYLLERRPGIIIRQIAPPGLPLDPETVRRMGEAFIANLAHLHQLDYQAAGLGEWGRPTGYVQRQIAGWTQRYRQAQTEELPDVDALITWLTQQMPAETGAAIIHNDYKFDNIVLDPADCTRIRAVLDWEMCTIGDPLMDLGTTLSYWVQADEPALIQLRGPGVTALPGSLTRRELAARYSAQTGYNVSNLLYYYCYGLFKLVTIIQQIYYRYVHGLTRDTRFAHMNQQTALLSRVARQALETGQV